MDNPNNRMIAAGRLESRPELSHEVMNEPFYSGTLLVKRLSGAVDRLPVTLPGKLLTDELMKADTLLLAQGQVRSYNKLVDGAGRLVVTLFVQHLTGKAENSVLAAADVFADHDKFLFFLQFCRIAAAWAYYS